MTKQNKKTIKTQAKKQNKTAPAPKKESPAVDFKTELRASPDNILQALRKTKKQRGEYLAQLMTKHKPELLAIAQRRGLGTLAPDNNPLKSELGKIKTIESFTNKTRENITARMVYSLMLAYLNRDSESGFARVFPTGLFIENGSLKDLMTANLIKSNGGENEKQSFTFTEKARQYITDAQLLKLEKTITEGGLI